MGKLGQERIDLHFRDQRKAHRKTPAVSVDTGYFVCPVELLGLERGLSIHLEIEYLIELALGRERQGDSFGEDVGFAEAQNLMEPADLGSSADPIAPASKRPSGVSLPLRRKSMETACDAVSYRPHRGDHQRVVLCKAERRSPAGSRSASCPNHQLKNSRTMLRDQIRPSRRITTMQRVAEMRSPSTVIVQQIGRIWLDQGADRADYSIVAAA